MPAGSDNAEHMAFDRKTAARLGDMQHADALVISRASFGIGLFFAARIRLGHVTQGGNGIFFALITCRLHLQAAHEQIAEKLESPVEIAHPAAARVHLQALIRQNVARLGQSRLGTLALAGENDEIVTVTDQPQALVIDRIIQRVEIQIGQQRRQGRTLRHPAPGNPGFLRVTLQDQRDKINNAPGTLVSGQRGIELGEKAIMPDIVEKRDDIRLDHMPETPVAPFGDRPQRHFHRPPLPVAETGIAELRFEDRGQRQGNSAMHHAVWYGRDHQPAGAALPLRNIHCAGRAGAPAIGSQRIRKPQQALRRPFGKARHGHAICTCGAVVRQHPRPGCLQAGQIGACQPKFIGRRGAITGHGVISGCDRGQRAVDIRKISNIRALFFLAHFKIGRMLRRVKEKILVSMGLHGVSAEALAA